MPTVDYNIPEGNFPLMPRDRTFIIQAINGDKIVLRCRIYLRDGRPVDYDNSILTFTIRDHRFAPSILWIGTWRDGIERVASDHPGLIMVTLPDTISSSLRRGSYIFSLRVTDKLGKNSFTTLEGMLQIEYAPTSDTHDIPYRSDTV